MTTVDEIKQAVLSLPEAEYAKIMDWLHGLAEEAWDREIRRGLGGRESWKLWRLKSEVEFISQSGEGKLRKLPVHEQDTTYPRFSMCTRCVSNRRTPRPKRLTQEFKNRVGLFCSRRVRFILMITSVRRQVNKYCRRYWMTLRDKLRYRAWSRPPRRQEPMITLLQKSEKFLSECQR